MNKKTTFVFFRKHTFTTGYTSSQRSESVKGFFKRIWFDETRYDNLEYI